MSGSGARALAAITTAALVALIGGLLAQHFRHGWPFSLHHGLPPTSAATAAAGGALTAGSAAPAHPRVEVALDARETAALGVRVEAVRRETFSQALRTMATVVPDEARVSHVHTRIAGWIERLQVGTTGSKVRAGQPLAGIFSQDLLSTQAEYLAARRAAAGGPPSGMVAAARARLGVFGMSDREIRAIEAADRPRRLVTVTAPRSGIVLHRGIAVGTAVDPSTEIVTIADLSVVWVLAEVPEGDIPRVRVGTPASLTFPASGREPFEGQVEFLSPTLSERTRTLRVRFSVPNPDGSLRPGLYGSAVFQVTPRTALTVPRDAVVDTGATQHVFVVTGAGRYAPRAVELGGRFDDRVEILSGLAEGDGVVASGVFLLDSESRLRASGGGTGHDHAAMSHGAGDASAHAGHGTPSPASGPVLDAAPAGSAAHAGHATAAAPAGSSGVAAPSASTPPPPARGTAAPDPHAGHAPGHQGH